jgi:hypothetical protein
VKLWPVADQRMIGGRFLAFEHAIQAHRAVTACLDGLRDLGLVVSFAGASTKAPVARMTAWGRSRTAVDATP